MEPPTGIDPYTILQVPITASTSEIRSAYRKLALRLHPDKAAPADRETANKSFQDLAFAYAVLGDERRRNRYDATGNIGETLDLNDDGFDWGDFFRTQYAELVTAEKIAEFHQTYKGSAEERQDVLDAYRKGHGNLDYIFEHVVLSNPLDDEDRFRQYIDEAIQHKEIVSLKAYAQESIKTRQRRHGKAKKEKEEAETYTKAHAKNETKSKSKSKAGSTDMNDLALQIQQRNEQRRDTFLDGLLEKYGGKGKKLGTSDLATLDEPDEEAFAEMGRRKKRKLDSAALHDGTMQENANPNARTSKSRRSRKT